MTELKICSRLPGFWTCPSQKEQVLGNGCVANLGWNGGKSTTQSGLRPSSLRMCLEWMIEKLNLAQNALKEVHQTGWNEASIENW